MKHKIPRDTNVFHYYNSNPKNKITNDCVIRAISTAMDKTWDEVFNSLYNIATKYKLMMNDPKCYTRYLKEEGWIKQKAPRKVDNTRYTGREFCELIPDEEKVYTLNVIANIGTHHITAIIGGKIYDTWDCSAGKIGNYWTQDDYGVHI